MKVEFLNDELTLARVTRGFLWWKQQATVRRHPDYVRWYIAVWRRLLAGTRAP